MSLPPIVGAAGFASAWMLLWVAAGGIPIAIHLLTRRRQVAITWAAMQLLQRVVEKESKRIRLEQILILALRILILVTFAIAMARPFLADSTATAERLLQAKPKLIVIGIDTSYSMGYRTDGPSRFEEAINRAVAMIEAGSQGDAYALVELSDPGRAIVRQPTFDQRSAIAALRRLRLPDTSCDMNSSLQIVIDIVDEASQSTNLPKDISTILLSDLGKDSWEPLQSRDGSAALRKLAQMCDLQIVSLASKPTSNVAITALAPSSRTAIVNASIEFTVQLTNFQATDVQQLPVQFAIDGNTISSKYVDIPSLGSNAVNFSYSPSTFGHQVFSASIPEDRLLADNTRWLSLEARDRTSALFVEDRDGAARLLRVAFAPLETAADSVTRTISSAELLSTELSRWDIVFLVDLANLDPNSFARLARYVQAGGRLVVALGDETSPSTWNSLRSSVDLLGFDLSTVSDFQSWDIDPTNYDSPVLAPFAGFPDAGLLTTPIFRYWRIDNASSKLANDIMLTNGEPLITRNQFGSGWVASILSKPESGIPSRTQVEPSWNAMAAWPSFVPLVQQLGQTLMESQSSQYNLFAGQLMQGQTLGALGSASVTIVRPDGTESSILVEAEADYPTLPWQFSDTRSAGVYAAHQQNGEVTPYCVNVNSRESSLEAIELTDLPLPQSSLVRKGEDGAGQPNEDQPTRRSEDDQLSRIVLCWLLVLLCTESLLAWHIGRRVG